jgi:hypothetical protein
MMVMDEVIALENEIRSQIAAIRKELAEATPGEARRFNMAYVFEGESILAGKATFAVGSRLSRLRAIADGLRGQKL